MIIQDFILISNQQILILFLTFLQVIEQLSSLTCNLSFVVSSLSRSTARPNNFNNYLSLCCFLSIIPLLCQMYYFSFSPFSFLFYCFQLELCNKTAAKSHYCPAPSVGSSLPIFSFPVTSLL